MFGVALTTALAYYVILMIPSFYAHAFTNRPIVICPIIGALLGDAHTGLILGAQLEMIFIGITTIGGSLPSDVTLAGTIVTAFVIGSGVSLTVAMPLAVAIGIVAAMFTLMNRILISGAYVPFFEKWASEGKYKTYTMWAIVGQFVLGIVPTLTVFLSIYLGADAVKGLMAKIPVAVQHGMSVAAGMMPAVGIALLMNMLWSTKMSIYFFFGFGVSVYLNLNMTAMIVIAAFITVAQVYNDMKIRDSVKGLKAISGGEESDLFG